jgi:hypothetical protein
MSLSRTPRRLALATTTFIVLLMMGATAAWAKVGPDTPEGAVPTQTRTVTVTYVDWGQLALAAVAACAIGIAATLAVQAVLRHSHRQSMAHA